MVRPHIAIMGERRDGVVGSRHGATAHCDYGREEWGLSLVR